MIVWNKTQLMWPVLMCFSSASSECCPHLRFYQSCAIVHFQSWLVGWILFFKLEISVLILGASPVPVISWFWILVLLTFLYFHLILWFCHFCERKDISENRDVQISVQIRMGSLLYFTKRSQLCIWDLYFISTFNYVFPCLEIKLALERLTSFIFLTIFSLRQDVV